ncbi:MAG: TdeIII family type II restriction endonuclease [Terriglobales bacterium]
MALNAQTRDQVRGFLLNQVTRYIQQNLANQRHKPFHERLMPPLSIEGLSERSFSTRLGSWFQNIARMVALQYGQEAQSNCLVQGHIRPAATALITAILDDMDHGQPHRVPNRAVDVAAVFAVQGPGGANDQVRSDLFVRRQDGEELYFEIKTPDPNKQTCRAMKKDILTIMALRHGHNAQAYAACAYNPYGDGQPYVSNFVGQFLEIGSTFLSADPSGLGLENQKPTMNCW